MNGVYINETTKFVLNNPTNSSHAINIDEAEGVGSLVIPLLINGVTSYFTCRKPTQSEYKNGDLPRTYFSEEARDWDLSYQDYA